MTRDRAIGAATPADPPSVESRRIAMLPGDVSAAVHFVNDADAASDALRLDRSSAGIGGRPTLVQNVESLAYAALIARLVTPGTAAGSRRGARDSPGHRQRVGRPAFARSSSGTPSASWPTGRRSTPAAQAVLLGGYFGGWVDRPRPGTALDPVGMRRAGRAFGCGVRLVPAAGTLRCERDGPDHGLHGRPERRPMRALRLRPPGHRRRDRSARARARRGRRPRAGSNAGAASRRPWRLPASRTGRLACWPQRPATFRRRVRSATPVGRAAWPLSGSGG